MPTLIQDPDLARSLIEDRCRKGIDLYDEVWEGVYVILPCRNDEHQELVGGLMVSFGLGMQDDNRAKVRPGVNVSDRIDDWKYNYRIRDGRRWLA